jgi:integrase
MAKPYLLKPTFHKKHNKWRLNLPAAISPSGKRERHLFEKHSEALAEANKIRTTFHDFGRSIKMLPANRLVEAIECWDKLDEVSGREAPSGSLRNIVWREIKVRKERAKSISLNGLFDEYLAKLKRNHRSEHYVKAFKWLRGMFKEFLEEKVSDLKATDVKYAFEELPSGQFNAQLRLIRAVFNYGVKIGYLKSNPALNLEFVYRPKVEVKPLPNEIVRGMLNDAATNSQRIELLPYLALGFGTGCREAELFKILWSDVFLAESRLLIRANVSKTKRKRYIEIPANCREWLRLYLSQTTVQPEERIMRSFTPSKLRDARAANYKAAGGIGQEPQNSKRRTCASCHVALHEDYDKLSLQLGHTHSAMSLQYVGGVTKQQAAEYFDIRPSA